MKDPISSIAGVRLLCSMLLVASVAFLNVASHGMAILYGARPSLQANNGTIQHTNGTVSVADLKEMKETVTGLTTEIENLRFELGSLNHQVTDSQTSEKEKDEKIQALEQELDKVRKSMATTAAATVSQQRQPQSQPQNDSPLPPPPATRLQCDELMQRPNSPYAGGQFLTRHTTPGRWIPRADDSREYDIETCALKRYTAQQARQCLANQHVSFIGDSLTRYQYLSLAYFLHKGEYPPRFGQMKHCTHFNEHNQSACSPKTEPNICMETDWRPQEDGHVRGWDFYHQQVGGGTNGGIFNGHMECDCLRVKQREQSTELMLYASKTIGGSGARFNLSYVTEKGWGPNTDDLLGFNLTHCSLTGSCRRTNATHNKFALRAKYNQFDYQTRDLVTASAPNGTFEQQLGPVDIVIYNRGLWGPMTKNRTATVLPALNDWVQRTNHAGRRGAGKCFFKTTTASNRAANLRPEEVTTVRIETRKAGCGFFDAYHVTEGLGSISEDGERSTAFWDYVHYTPWVYEELNNVLLNVLCNTKKL